MNKYMFEIKNKSIDISIIVTIVETTKRQADIKLLRMLKNAYKIYKQLNKGNAINVNYTIDLINILSVEYLPNKADVKRLLEQEEKNVYPYLVFNVDYGMYDWNNRVHYENEINLNKCFLTSDDVNYRGIVNQEYNDYIKLKDVYKTK